MTWMWIAETVVIGFFALMIAIVISDGLKRRR